MAALTARAGPRQETDAIDPLWDQIKGMRPSLRSHVDIHRHVYRGRTWYVAQDHTTGRFFRLNESTYRLIGRLDGAHTLEQIWADTRARGGDEGITREDVVQLLSRLQRSDLVRTDGPPRTDELRGRARRWRRQKTFQRWRSPIAIRVPFVDPERFLNAAWPVARFLFTRTALVVWLVAMCTGGIVAAIHWTDLTHDVLGRVFSLHNGILLLLIFPIVKILHELGHAFAVKSIGGEVHEMGVIFLVFVPIPYVDASAASAERQKSRRILVGAAGMLVELFIAVIALVLWTGAEPGIFKAMMFNVVMIAGVSTVFFNANPLVRYDGYYIVADILEIPNLATRSRDHLAYLYQRYVIGLKGVAGPALDGREAFWLLAYGLLSFAYRCVIISLIVWFLVDRFFFFGVLTAIWALTIMVLIPLGTTVIFLFSSQKLKGYRARAIAASVLLLAIAAALTAIPVRYSTVAEGVVWADQNDWIRTRTEGFANESAVDESGFVDAGQVIVSLNNPELAARHARLELYLAELTARHDALRQASRVQAALTRQEIESTNSRIEEIESRLDGLVIRSDAAGHYVSLQNGDLAGRFLDKGALLGFVQNSDDTTVRVVVPQDQIDLVRRGLRRVEVRFSDNLSSVVAGEITRIVPSATQSLPSLALSNEGGGDLLLDPAASAASNPVSLQSFFQIDLKVPGIDVASGFGERVYVRFVFDDAPIALQLYRPLKQLFLSKFG